MFSLSVRSVYAQYLARTVRQWCVAACENVQIIQALPLPPALTRWSRPWCRLVCILRLSSYICVCVSVSVCVLAVSRFCLAVWQQQQRQTVSAGSNGICWTNWRVIMACKQTPSTPSPPDICCSTSQEPFNTQAESTSYDMSGQLKMNDARSISI